MTRPDTQRPHTDGSHSLRNAVLALITVMLSASTFVVATSASAQQTPQATALAVTTPYGIWGSSAVPKSPVDPDTSAVELGTKFTTAKTGYISALRYYKFSESQGSAKGTLWSDSGAIIAQALFPSSTGSGWKNAPLTTPISVTAGRVYTVSYTAPAGRYAGDTLTLGGTKQIISGDLTALAGVYSYSLGLPTSTWNQSAYYADVLFTPQITTITTTAKPTTTTTTTTKPTTTNTSTSTTTPKNCGPRPSACGFPDATNTGVTNAAVLRKVPSQITSGPGWHYDSRGWITIDGASTVFENIDTAFSVDVVADNVTIRNVRITATGEGWAIGLRHTKNATISDIDIVPSSPRLLVGIKDVYGDASGTRILRSDISGTSTGIQTHEGLIQDNYVHDLGFKSGDHVNGTTSNGSTTPLTIRHNTVFNQIGQTDAVSFFQDFGREANRTLDNNLLAGGGYTIYGGGGGYGTSSNIVITNNRIATIFFPAGGGYGPVAAFESKGAGNIWTGNIWDSTGLIIAKP